MGSEIQFHKTYYHRKRISAFLINENYLADWPGSSLVTGSSSRTNTQTIS